MRRQICLAVVVILIAGVLSGCGKPRLYAVDRPRVDQASTGNSGFLSGEKQEESMQTDGKATRRIYVFEFDRKKAPEEAKQDNKVVTVSPGTVDPQVRMETIAPPTKEAITLPYIGDDEPAAAADAQDTAEAGMLYTVVKDDTLGKISKKIYGTAGKWTKIYDANKDKLKNPNVLKEGIVLTIPRLE